MAILATLPKMVRIDSAGRPYAGARAFFYEPGTTTDKSVFTDAALNFAFPQPVEADSEGQFPPIYYDETQTYKLILKTASGVQIDSVDPCFVAEPAPLTQDDIGDLLYPITLAETAANATISNGYREPGDIRRYGAISDGTSDCSAAIQVAINQAQSLEQDRANVRIPASAQGWKVNTGLTTATVTGIPFKIVGDSMYYSILYTAADITMLTISDVQALAGVVLQDFKMGGIGVATSSKPGLHIENSSQTICDRLYVRDFDTGVKYDGGAHSPNSSFSCSMRDCTITACGINIDALASTNFLCLYNTTFGGALGANGIGCRVTDCAGFLISGGDCEGCELVGLDLDASVDSHMGAVVQATDFEGNTASDGVIRLGNTAIVRGITLNGISVGGTVGQWVLNPVNADRVTVIDVEGGSGTISGKWINDAGSITNLVVISNYLVAPTLQVLNGTVAYSDATIGFTGRHADARTAIAYGASMTPDAAKGNTQEIIITDTSAMTINAPTNAVDGQELTLWLNNSSGSAHGTITWDVIYHLAGALAAIATDNNKSITFQYRATSVLWYERYRSAADVPN